MNDELPFLVKLQSFDLDLADLHSQIDDITPKIKTHQNDIEILKSSAQSAKEKIIQLQLKKKNLEMDIEAKEKLIKKHQSELNSVKSNDAYKAMLSEIENAKKDQIAIEDQVLDVMEQLDQSEKEQKSLQQNAKVKEDEIRKKISTLDDQISDLKKRIIEKEKERQGFADTVPAGLRDQYESIRKKREGVAIVPVHGNSCGGCQMSVPPHKIMEIKKAKSMILCESCMRILYLPPESKSQPEESSLNANPSSVSSS